jgi:hypothetical protein
MRCEVWDMGYGIWGRIQGMKYGTGRIQDTGYRIQDTAYSIQDLRYGIWIWIWIWI